MNGVSFTGAEQYVNGSNRSPFTTNLGNFDPRIGASWQPVHTLVVRGGAGFYYGQSAEMSGGAALDSDGFSSVTNWNATCYNADGNTTVNGSSQCANAAPSSTGPFSLSNPFPTGVVPLINAPTGLANNLEAVMEL